MTDTIDIPATVARHATLKALLVLVETTRVYRQLALEFHPDRNPAGGPTMRALNQLMDAVRADVRAAEMRP